MQTGLVEFKPKVNIQRFSPICNKYTTVGLNCPPVFFSFLFLIFILIWGFRALSIDISSVN